MTNTTLPFTEYWPDGWPLCPVCGEDELMSQYAVLKMHNPKDSQQNQGQDIHDLVIRAGYHCLNCGWRLEAKP